jgi:hypothetical protein
LELEYLGRIVQLELKILWGVIQLELDALRSVVQLELDNHCHVIQLELGILWGVIQLELDVRLLNRSIKAWTLTTASCKSNPSFAILVVSRHVIFSPTC